MKKQRVIDLADYKKQARELAKTHKNIKEYGRRKISNSIKITSREIISLDKYYNILSKNEYDISDSVAEWLSDNYEFIKSTARSANENIKNISDALPVLTDIRMRGIPRIFAFAAYYTDTHGGSIKQNELTEYIKEYQSGFALTMSELWSLKTVFEAVLIKNILTVCARSRRLLTDKIKIAKSAIQYCQNVKPKSISTYVNVNDLRQLAYFTDTVQTKTNSSDTLYRLDRELHGLGLSAEAIIDNARNMEFGFSVLFKNLVISLMSLGKIDWENIFESVSVVDSIFTNSETSIFAQMDTDSKNIYRKRLALIAKKKRINEIDAANDIVYDAEKQNCDVGNILFEGNDKKLRGVLYCCILYGLTCIMWYFAFVCMTVEQNTVAAVFSAIVLPIPCLQISERIINSFFGRIIKPKQFCRIDFSQGLPTECSTAVLVPSLLDNTEHIKSLISLMEANYIANKSNNLRMVLLGDYAQADSRNCINDEKIKATVCECMCELNKKYGKRIFYYFQRPRKYNSAEKCYMGWERKRGAILEFNRYITGGTQDGFCYICNGAEELIGTKYVVTLDSDTIVPFNGILRLVGTLHHPLNAPIVDDKRKIVISGYGILQPRMETSIASAYKTKFSKTMSSSKGSSPYITGTFEEYQDIFGKGTFSGKGIYSPNVFSDVLDGRFEDNTILSHDMPEGIYLNAAYVSDIVFYDEIPSNYISYRKRTHRWIRGDWQLLPFTKRYVFNQKGIKIKNEADLIAKLKIIQNLRRTLFYPSIGINALLGIFNVRFLYTALLLLAAYGFIPLIFEIYDKLKIRKSGDIPIKDENNSVKLALSEILYALDYAYNAADAIIRTLCRLKKHERLLEWQTAMQAESKTNKGISAYYNTMLASAIIGVALFIKGCITGNALCCIFGAIYMLSPLTAYVAGFGITKKQEMPNAEQLEIIEFAAKGAWTYFRELCTEEHNYLPPDNYQALPYKGAAARTSPTNIGMMLVGCMAAVKLEYTNYSEAIEMIYNALISLDKLEKWNGNPYNWYDTKNLSPLEPRFVSSADNGNLACALLALREGLSLYCNTLQNDGLKQKSEKCIEIIKKLLHDMDFSLLYDNDKELFSVGFDVQNGKLSPYAYDLFASEARQTSFYAIISGQVPVKHWERLSREAVMHDNRIILKSWSGSMFEYLMPAIFMKTYDGSFAQKVYDGVIREQIKYTKKRKLPWGISESGYFQFDDQMNYQYKAFGIPIAAIRRINGNETVISPYACALALPFCEKASAENLLNMKKLGLCGIFGFYEACDITNEEKTYPVSSFMAHHEGMILLSAANALCDNYITELFHAASEVKAGEHLLQEKIPASCKKAILKYRPKIINKPNNDTLEESLHGISEYPRLTTLSDGDYGLVISACGSNYSHYGDIMINKWKTDELNERYGHFIFTKDEDSGNVCSATPSPLYNKCNNFRTSFTPHKVSFDNTCIGLQTTLDVCVTGEYNATVFMLNIKNVHNRQKRIFVADYAQAALETSIENAAHPQYSDMFIRTKFDKEKGTLYVKRLPRNSDGTVRYAAIVLAKNFDSQTEYMTSKRKFIGRNRNLCNPEFCDNGFVYGNDSQTDISQCLSLGCRVRLMPNESIKLCYTLIYSQDDRNIEEYADHFANIDNCAAVFDDVYERAKINFRANNISPKEYALSNRIISALYYPSVYDKSFVRPCEKNVLWKYGISGDLPIVSLRVANNYAALELVLKLYLLILKAKISLDLVLISSDDGYHGDNYEEIKRRIEFSCARSLLNKRGGIFIVRNDKNSANAELAECFAQVKLYGSPAKIYSLLTENNKTVKLPFAFRTKRQYGKAKSFGDCDLEFFNGYGGFDLKKHEYKILLSDGVHTPQPWSNVIANENFGTLVTESGGGFTWYKNSRENKLTTWSNDPIEDPLSEAVYIKDEGNSEIMTAKRLTHSRGNYEIRYGMGYAIYSHSENDVDITETVFVPAKANVKVSMIDITNNSDKTKKLSVYRYVDCRLSSAVSAYEEGNVSFYDAENGILFSKNNYIPENSLAFITSDRKIKSVVNNKLEFFGRFSSEKYPKSLYAEKDSMLTSNSDCMVIKTVLEIQPHCSKRTVFLFGAVDECRQAADIKKYFKNNNIQKIFDDTKAYIANTVRPFEIITADKTLDALFNNFLLYQTYICRYFAKTSFYQCSGAFGFRDQLQDSLAFMYCDNKQARKHILRAALQQFEQGDVRHWWHESTGYGIRTKISDDMMFLPYVCCEYVRFTNDWQIFDEQVPFAKGQEIKDGKDSDFGKTFVSENTASLYEHCIAAIKRAAKFGKHGLLLIGTGDWNDGFDKVGEQGKGESVWLTFFTGYVIKLFATVCEKYGDTENMEYIDDLYKRIEKGIESVAWDGEWFRRAYYDDGTPMGSVLSDECKIDIIAQAWACISGMADKEKLKSALNSAEKYLVDEKNGIVKLFAPPFESSLKNPGYIKSYRSGLRENGGQYTHGAVWLIQAYMMMGESEKAYRILKMLNPVNHSLTKVEAEKYKVEPYVVSADVYSAKGAYGMGGWSWYTGAAAWLYKIILEYVIGIIVSGDEISLSEYVPDELLPLRVNYVHKYGGENTPYTIDIIPSKSTSKCLHDTVECDFENIKLYSDGRKHKIVFYREKKTSYGSLNSPTEP